MIKGGTIPLLGIHREGMRHGQSIPVIQEFFHITFVENPGMAFGIDVTPATKLWVSLFSIIAVIGLLYYLYSVREQSFSLRFALAMILGGAVGNLIDRLFYGIFYGYGSLFYGKVVDFLDFDFFNVTIFGRSYERFPVFNVADSAVTIGVLILILFYNRHVKEAEHSAVTASAGQQTDSENKITTDVASAPEPGIGNPEAAQHSPETEG